MSSSPLPILAADFEFFSQYKSFLAANNGQASTLQVTPYPEGHSHLGIYNQGATCYLNSILQTLFYDEWFRNTILSMGADTAAQLPPLIKELQRLFALLLTSENGAVSALDLISSFGWSRSQMFEQHDAHEFYNVLLNSLEKSSPDLAVKLAAVYEGSCSDCLTCPKCGLKSEKADKLVNLSIDLPDALEEPSKAICDIDGLLETHITPETLDVDNMWSCSGCNEKVQAVKSKIYTKLPDRLVLHLKRFRFDPISRKRRKLNTVVKLRSTLDVKPLVGGYDQDCAYELCSVLLHSGTAMGGHYRAFIKCRSDGKWYDFNDVLVTQLSKEEETSLFSTFSDSTAGESVSSRYRDLVQENAYMLIYDRSSRYLSGEGPAEISTSLRGEVEAMNVEYRNLKRFTDIRNSIYEFSIFLRSPRDIDKFDPSIEDGCAISDMTFKYGSTRGNEYRLEIAVSQEADLALLLSKAHSVFAKCGLVSSCSPSELSELNRLRLYNEDHPDKLGETFGLKLATPLNAFGCFYAKPIFSRDAKNSNSGCSLLMETRSADDKPFVEHSAKDMRVNIAFWKDVITCPQIEYNKEQNTLNICTTNLEPNSNSSSSIISVAAVIGSYTTKTELLVPGEDKACTQSLYVAIRAILPDFGFDPHANFTVIHYSDRFTTEIRSDSDETADGKAGLKLLRRDYGIWPGDNVIVEVLSEGVEPVALAAMHSTRSSIILSYNNPTASSAHPEYDFILETSLDSTISKVKEQLGRALGLDPVTFHIKRALNGPQFKDDSKTLEEYSIVDRGILHVQLGKGCSPGEHLVKFDLDVKDQVTSLGELPVNEKMTVLQLKELLLSAWRAKEGAFASTSIPCPESSAWIRLKDGKTMQSTTVMRDDRVLVRCLVGMTDGRRLVVQLLNEAETLAADDILLTVRSLSYESKSMSRPLDLVVKRSNTASHLYSLCVDRFFPSLKGDIPAAIDGLAPRVDEVLEIAKYGLTTVPLTLKATSKLKWNDPAWLTKDVWEAPLDRPPLGLRDGSVIVLRSRADYEKAKAAAKANKAASGGKDGDDTPPVLNTSSSQPNLINPIGGSSNISRIRAMSAHGRRNKAKQPAENGIAIEVLAPPVKRVEAENTVN